MDNIVLITLGTLPHFLCKVASYYDSTFGFNCIIHYLIPIYWKIPIAMDLNQILNKMAT
jgi:hypothetical protein